MDALVILREFGWLGFTIIWLMTKIFPSLWTFLTDKVFPARALERAKKLEQQAIAEKAQREAEATLVKAKIERELREEEHRRKIEERMTSAIEQMSMAITVLNERVAHLITAHSAHDQFTTEAVGDMRETVIKLQKRDTQRKIRAVRKSKT